MGYTLLDGDDPSIEVVIGVFRKVRVALGATYACRARAVTSAGRASRRTT
jgi:hypothetical protein